MAASDIVPTAQKPLAFKGASTDGDWSFRPDGGVSVGGQRVTVSRPARGG